MAEPQTRENSAQNPVLTRSHSTFPADPDPGNAPPLPPPHTVAASDDLSIADPELTRESKRRKHCPVALENLEELMPASNSSFTFTFDTKFCGFSAEVTPKFGSFNSILPEIEKKNEESEIGSDGKAETVLREEEDSEVVIGEALLESVAD